ncbi:MAG TPA: Uma2 family endonuclease [Thermoanaerobaculia bacterium]|nr:Uma2 family endonuclease [Thermoanaerobaculia bacterium]
MAEPAWKTPIGTPEHEDSDEPLEEAVLQRWVKRPDGGRELLELPLTRELFLDPQLGDTMVQGEWHDITAGEISGILRNHFRLQADVRVFHDMKHYLLPRKPAPSPDVSVVRGLGPRRRRSSFRVKREGVRPSLLIEVVSPGAEARQGDLVDKVELYRLAGIPEYLIADSPGGVTGLPFKLLGYRLDASGRYQPIQPDAEGRFLSETTGIWFQVSPDGQRIFLFDDPTGRRLLNLTEQEERADHEAKARKAAERKAIREAEARKTAEEKAIRETEARKAAEAEAIRETEAREAAEAEAARLRAELERLRPRE